MEREGFFFPASLAVGGFWKFTINPHTNHTHTTKKTDCVTDFTLQFGNKKKTVKCAQFIFGRQPLTVGTDFLSGLCVSQFLSRKMADCHLMLLMQKEKKEKTLPTQPWKARQNEVQSL